jgi:hypothetical protein
MTFEQFQASRRRCEDLAAELSADFGSEHKCPGNLYLGTLYIDAVQPWWPEAAQQGKWHLLLDRNEWISDDLASLERRLYEWAVSAGYDIETTDDLCDEYAAWNKSNNLSLGSADEHLFDENLTDDQRKWLRSFSERWQAARS